MNDLLTKLSDGTLTSEDAQALNDLLRGNPVACEQYLNHITLEAQIEREVSANPEISPIRPIRRSRPVSWVKPLLAAAAVVVLAGLAWHIALHHEVGPEIATVLFAEDCVWRQSPALTEGMRVPAGDVQLTRGTALLRFDGGAEVLLRDGTRLRLKSATAAELREGSVMVRTGMSEDDFELQTSAGALQAGPAEFGARVTADGAIHVDAVEGSVHYASSGAGSEGVLQSGKTLVLHDSSAVEFVTTEAPRFGEVMRQANPRARPDLMTAYEGFLYDEGSYSPEQISRGKGWTGPWRLRKGTELRNPNETDSATDMRIVQGRLNVVWPLEGGRLGALEMPAGRSFRVRQLKHGIPMDQDGVVFFSLMSHEPDHPPRPSRPPEGMRLTFRSSADYWGASLSFGWNENLFPRIQSPEGGAFTSPARVPDEQTLLWVGKIIHRATGEDEVLFRIYGQRDHLDYAEPATWHVVSRGLHQDKSLDLVVLSSTGRAARIVDELRIGPTWRSVVPVQPQVASAN